jgi:hypothetical protein
MIISKEFISNFRLKNIQEILNINNPKGDIIWDNNKLITRGDLLRFSDIIEKLWEKNMLNYKRRRISGNSRKYKDIMSNKETSDNHYFNSFDNNGNDHDFAFKNIGDGCYWRKIIKR